MPTVASRGSGMNEAVDIYSILKSLGKNRTDQNPAAFNIYATVAWPLLSDC